MHSPRVLIVEDDTRAGEELHDLCTDCGHEVRIATNESQARDLERRWAPDAVVLDIDMASMDGLRAAHRMRHRNDDTVLVAISDDADDALGAEACAAGCDLFMPKSCEAVVLVAALDHFLDLRSRPEPAGP